MSMFGKPKGKKYNTRTIEVTAYEHDDQRLVVEGCLTDHRLQEFHLATGEKRSPGIMHQVIIHLLVNKTTLEIEDLHVEMPVVPREECVETIKSVEPIKGLRIASGFTSTVKSLVGKGRGCNHLVALLTSMGPSTLQGYYAYRLQGPPRSIMAMINKVVDSCWTWRAEGPLINLIKEQSKGNIKK
jgi:hypothetical protein